MITRKKINELYKIEESPCVSIYIPTSRAGASQEDRLRFKNALKEAHAQLVDHGMESKAAHKMMADGYEMLDDENYWMHLSDGLAVFFTPKRTETFIVPVDVNYSVHVGNRLQLRPLLPVITGRQRFFLLAISQNEIRFFEGNKYSITPVIIEDLVPEDMEEALSIDEIPNSLQAHSGRSSGPTPIYHGNDLGKDHKLKRLRQYLRRVDDGLMEMLHDEEAPMVIAAVDYLVPIYKEVSRYKNIADVHIGGNPENDDPILLHEKAWTIIDQFNQNEIAETKELYPEMEAKRKATSEFSTVLNAAKDGRIDTLFVNKDQEIWGTYNTQTRDLNIQKTSTSKNEELLESAAMEVFMQGGKVYNVEQEEMPNGEKSMNALLRYNLS